MKRLSLLLLAVLAALSGAGCFAVELKFISPAEAWDKDVIRGSAYAKAVINAKAVKAISV